MWIPFHFYPANEGNTLSEKLICRKNSLLVNEMFNDHIKHMEELPYVLQLIGIASHVYMDTFSHYGFSGVSSRNNKVKSDSFKFDDVEEDMNRKLHKFNRKHKKDNFIRNWRDNKSWKDKILTRFKSNIAEIGSGALGHGAVATFPDQPYLKWSFVYEEKEEISERNNSQTYLEGCEKLYLKLKHFSKLYYKSDQLEYINFSKIKQPISEILSFYGDKDERINKWLDYIKNNKLFKMQDEEFLDYNETKWENKKIEFHNLKTSSEVVKFSVYKFHQAADYHRHYTLKTLLPKYGIIIN